MKIIRYEQFVRLRQELTAYADCKADTYGYLYLLINDRAYGQTKTDSNKLKLLSLEQIKILWNSEQLRRRVVELAILRHYRNCIVETEPGASSIVSTDDLKKFGMQLKRCIIK